MPSNPVGYFEIPVTDLERAIAFYSSVFGFEMERLMIDGNDMALFPMFENAGGSTGALAKGESYLPSQSGTLVYFSTKSIDETLKRVHAQGGKTLYPKTSLGELGSVAEFEDSEGNRVALHSQAR